MAYAEKYVSQSGSGLRDGSSAVNAWSVADMKTDAAAGDRINYNSALTLTGSIFDNAGTLLSYICLRAYNSVIGDLDTQGLNSDGTLDTTNFPAVTISGGVTIQNYIMFMNCKMTGSLATALINDSASDYAVFWQCYIEQQGTSRVLRGDNYWLFVACEFQNTGTAQAAITLCDSQPIFYGCYFAVASITSSSSLVEFQNGYMLSCTFLGNGLAEAVAPTVQSNWVLLGNCTGYNFGTVFLGDNGAMTRATVQINCHFTDSSKMYDNQYAATANHQLFEFFCRYRDVTTLRTGLSDEGIRVGEVDTDTGGPSTDYTDAANGDLSLISGAPGIDAGLGIGDWDIGAYQNAEGGGGGDTYSPLIISPNGNRIGVREV